MSLINISWEIMNKAMQKWNFFKLKLGVSKLLECRILHQIPQTPGRNESNPPPPAPSEFSGYGHAMSWPLTFMKVKFVAAQGTTVSRKICYNCAEMCISTHTHTKKKNIGKRLFVRFQTKSLP